jgi:hypothetical protein
MSTVDLDRLKVISSGSVMSVDMKIDGGHI